MRRRPSECLVLLQRAIASPPFSVVRLTFDTHPAALEDREQKHDPMTGRGKVTA